MRAHFGNAKGAARFAGFRKEQLTPHSVLRDRNTSAKGAQHSVLRDQNTSAKGAQHSVLRDQNSTLAGLATSGAATDYEMMKDNRR